MPLPVTPWAASTFPTAKSLNLAMVTLDGTLNKPTGVLFHARRPMQLEAPADVMTFSGSGGGTRTSALAAQSGNRYFATVMADNAGYYGQTSDGSYTSSQYRLVPVIAGSAGDGITPGGVTIICHTLPLAGAGSSFKAAGADLFNGASTYVCAGARQAACKSHDTITFFLDLQDTAGTVLNPAGFVTDSGGNSASMVINTTDSSGETGRFFTLWAGAGTAQQARYGTPAAPAPYAAFTAATDIGTTSAATVNINGATGIKGPLDFLSNPPLLRVHSVAGTNVPNGTATQLALGASADLDPYGGWASPSYTVARDGLYLAHGLVYFSSSGTGNRRAGISVNGTTYWGPGYPGTSSALCGATKTQILDLAAGDTVSLYAQQSSGGGLSLATSEQTRLVLAWLGAKTAPAQLWTPPVLGSGWAAGATALPALWQQRVANDLGFLVSRPFFLGRQATAQAGFVSNSVKIVTMDTAGGIVHGGPGDPYGGWTAGTSNSYTAVAAGWYLAVLEAFATFPSTTSTCALTAGFSVTTSGGRSPQTGFDRYQQIFPPASGYQPGATAAGLYYLLPGESITPQVLATDWTGTTWGTSAAAGTQSHLELVWVSE